MMMMTTTAAVTVGIHCRLLDRRTRVEENVAVSYIVIVEYYYRYDIHLTPDSARSAYFRRAAPYRHCRRSKCRTIRRVLSHGISRCPCWVYFIRGRRQTPNRYYRIRLARRVQCFFCNLRSRRRQSLLLRCLRVSMARRAMAGR